MDVTRDNSQIKCTDLKKCGEIATLLSIGKSAFFLNCGFCEYTFLQLDNFIQHIYEDHKSEFSRLEIKQEEFDMAEALEDGDAAMQTLDATEGNEYNSELNTFERVEIEFDTIEPEIKEENDDEYEDFFEEHKNPGKSKALLKNTGSKQHSPKTKINKTDEAVQDDANTGRVSEDPDFLVDMDATKTDSDMDYEKEMESMFQCGLNESQGTSMDEEDDYREEDNSPISESISKRKVVNKKIPESNQTKNNFIKSSPKTSNNAQNVNFVRINGKLIQLSSTEYDHTPPAKNTCDNNAVLENIPTNNVTYELKNQKQQSCANKTTSGLNANDSINITTESANPVKQEFQIVTSYFQKLLGNQKTLISGLKFVADSLLKFETELLKEKGNKASEEHHATENTDIIPFFNIASETDIKTLEKLLENKETVTAFKGYFKKIIGGRQPKSEAGKCVHQVINKMFHKNFWLRCSWKGGSNEKGVIKFAMNKFENVLSAIISLIREVSDEDYAESYLRKVFECKMRNRHILTRKRSSAPKMRPKGLNYKKRKNIITTNANDKCNKEDSETVPTLTMIPKM